MLCVKYYRNKGLHCFFYIVKYYFFIYVIITKNTTGNTTFTMLRILGNNHKNYSVSNQFFKEFKDESLIWTAYLWASEKNEDKNKYLDLLNKRHSFESITLYLQKEFENTNENELTDFLEKCYRLKNQYIPNDDFEFLEKDHRLCWFIINNLENENKDLKRKRYKYENPYFSLIFLIHIELLDQKISVEDLRKYKKTLNENKNPHKFLDSYIENKSFITWALEYTEKKYRIRTNPSFTPTDYNEELEVFLGYWDYQYLNNQYKYLHEINALKKAWQQKQFRDKGGPKKPYHLPLTKNTKSQLEKLAEKMNISETKILEKLLDDAYKKEMLNEKGKALY